MFKLDQKGQSLPIVLGVTALILANTYYFLAVDKSSSARNKMTQTTIETQTEQSRISAYLADINACAKQTLLNGVPTGAGVGNFFNKSLATLSDTAGMNFDLISSTATGAQTFLKKDERYARKTLKVTKYYLQPDDSISASATNEIRYYLVVEYQLKNPNDKEPYSDATDFPVNNTRKTSITKVPLVIQRVSAGDDRIINCYARPSTLADTNESTSSMSTAVREACKNPATPADTNTAYLNTTSSAAIATCNHNIALPSCGAGMVLNSAGINQAAGVNFNRQEFTCAPLITTPCAASPNPTVMNGVINSVGQCASATSCGTGSMMIKNGATTFTCTTNCNIGTVAAYQLFHSYNSSGTPTCYDLARSVTCPAGQYAKSVNQNGVPTCEYIKYRNVSCPNSYFATDMDPVNGLNCQYLNKAKDCAGSNNYIAHFAWTSTACKNFTY